MSAHNIPFHEKIRKGVVGVLGCHKPVFFLFFFSGKKGIQLLFVVI